MHRRSAVAVLVLSLSLSTVPLQARPANDPGSGGGLRERIVKVVQHLVRTVLGDGLSVPHP
jgi:hypothetical protein